jgi:cytoskeletal protein CcmA (bactofilin family)
VKHSPKLLAQLWATLGVLSLVSAAMAEDSLTAFDLRTKRTGADKDAFSFRHNRDGVFRGYSTGGTETSSWNAQTGTFTGTFSGTHTGTFPAGSLTGQVDYAHGGTGQSSVATGDLLYGASASSWARLTGNSTTSKRFLTMTGTGSNPQAPSWLGISVSDLPTVDTAHGGTGVTSVASGALLVGTGSTAMSAIAPGTSGYVLTMNGSNPEWQPASGGGGGGHTQNTDTGTDQDVFTVGVPGPDGKLKFGDSTANATYILGNSDDQTLQIYAQNEIDFESEAYVFDGPVSGISSLNATDFHGDGSALTNLNPVNLSVPVPPTLGGTGFSSNSLGDIVFGSAANTWSKLTGNSSTAKKFLTMTGTGSNPAAPSWALMVAGDLPTEAVRTDTVQTITGAKTMSSASNVFTGDGTALTIAPGNLNGAVTVAKGGLNRTSAAVGEIPYASSTSVYSGVTPNATTTNKFLTQSGNGSTPGAPAYLTIQAADLPAISMSTGVTSTLGATNGGTGQNTVSTGDILYGSGTNAWSKLTGNSSSTKKFMTSTGTGSVATAPTYDVLAAADMPTGIDPAKFGTGIWDANDGSVRFQNANVFIQSGTGHARSLFVKNTTYSGIAASLTDVPEGSATWGGYLTLTNSLGHELNLSPNHLTIWGTGNFGQSNWTTMDSGVLGNAGTGAMNYLAVDKDCHAYGGGYFQGGAVIGQGAQFLTGMPTGALVIESYGRGGMSSAPLAGHGVAYLNTYKDGLHIENLLGNAASPAIGNALCTHASILTSGSIESSGSLHIDGGISAAGDIHSDYGFTTTAGISADGSITANDTLSGAALSISSTSNFDGNVFSNSNLYVYGDLTGYGIVQGSQVVGADGNFGALTINGSGAGQALLAESSSTVTVTDTNLATGGTVVLMYDGPSYNGGALWATDDGAGSFTIHSTSVTSGGDAYVNWRVIN